MPSISKPSHPVVRSSRECRVRLRNENVREWGPWLWGNSIGEVAIDYYPDHPRTILYYIKYVSNSKSVLQEGYFNPAFGSVWFTGMPEPQIPYAMAKRYHEETTKVLVPLYTDTVVSGKKGAYLVWYKGALYPAGLGEPRLFESVQILEGLNQHREMDARSHPRLFQPGGMKRDDQRVVEELLDNDELLWDDRRKCVRQKRRWT